MITRMKYGLARLKYQLLRGLGVVSPSGQYPLPPRWALSAAGKHRLYDAPDCREACCPWNSPAPEPICALRCEAECCGPLLVSAGALPILRSPSRCAGPCGFCEGVMDPSDRDGLEGRERGAEQC
ncbi:hypothetical protein SEA_ABT2GRADUATEX2_21 [Streptomyces phage Abt2graduatex2]|nr:hypothetical protein SEA_ABT2GRADUATEX2_21 [Streptomyces phage Abt2graduatex2]